MKELKINNKKIIYLLTFFLFVLFFYLPFKIFQKKKKKITRHVIHVSFNSPLLSFVCLFERSILKER